MRPEYAMILSELHGALENVSDDGFERFAQAVSGAQQVFLVGVGRVMVSLEAFEKRLNHLGVRCWHVGSLNEPAITGSDLLIVGSGSGESLFPVAIAKKAAGFGAKIGYIGSNMQSSAASLAQYRLRIPVRTKLGLPGEISSSQIMSSLFEQSLYLTCDALCYRVAQIRGITDLKSLWRYHANLE